MLIDLEKISDTNLPIEVDGILPERLQSLNETEIAKIPVWIGRAPVELGSVFRVATRAVDSCAIRWSGNLANVHWIGAGMTSGEMEILSSTGRHVGSGLKAGSILVRGSVSDFAGVEMAGGTIRIEGDAGDNLGGCYPGSRWGMNRGEILVQGNAGRGVGQWMRRGLIAVGGDVDRLCGWNVLAGSILIFGNCGKECGSGMIRGTIVQVGDRNWPLSPTFSEGSSCRSGILNLFAAELKRLGHPNYADLLNRNLTTFHGDQLTGGRGEVLRAV